MNFDVQRVDGRQYNELRQVRISYDVFGYSAANVLFELGNTKVLCAITLQQGVPHFLKGKKIGWLTAEYAMLPASTNQRIQRETEAGKRNGRSIEISRFIGRSLRAAVDTTKIGERTIIIDCDVLQADGGTRTACITAASLALEKAQERWLSDGTLQEEFMRDGLIGISAGLYKGIPLIDLNFEEDSSIDADVNFVITRSGDLVEIQASAEHKTYTWQQFDSLRMLAQTAAQQLHDITQLSSKKIIDSEEQLSVGQKMTIASNSDKDKVPFFSLKNRLANSPE